MQLSHDLPSRACRGLFALLMVLAWSGGATAQQVVDPAPGSTRGTAAAPLSPAQAIEEADRLFEAIEQSAKDLPRESFDVAAMAAAVGGEPEKVLQWVRRNTRWVPYQGVLRGAPGTLMDRVGNSLDRSLLVAEMLRASGKEVRLARAELTEDQGRELLARAWAPAGPGADRGPAPAKAGITPDEYARANGLDPASVRAMHEQLAAPVLRMAEDLARRVEEQAPALQKALDENAGDAAAVPPVADDGDAATLAAARDHWWVQVRDGRAWKDLDPAAPDAPPGGVWVRATRAVAWDKAKPAPPLDRKQYHEVMIRLVIEQSKAGRLKQTTLFEHPMRAAELIGQRVVLTHVPMDWPVGQDLSAGNDFGGELAKLLPAQNEWVPVLRVGANSLHQAGFTTAGDVVTKPSFDGFARGARKRARAVSGATGLLDGLPTNPNEDAPLAAAEGVLTAEWIEYEIRVPGAESHTIRRDIFDLVGPAARATGGQAAEIEPDERQQLSRALAMSGQLEVLVLPCQLTAPFVQDLALRSALAARDSVLALGQPATARPDPLTLERLSKIDPLPAAPYAYALARSEFGRFRDRTFFDRPNVVAYHLGLRSPADGQCIVRAGLDIVANDVAVRPGEGVDPFRVRLEQGVLDTNAEVLAVGGTQILTTSAAEMLRRSPALDVRWIAVRGKDDAAWGQVNLPDDAKARILAGLDDGRIAIVPNRPVGSVGAEEVGWWALDPASGHVLGVSAAGGSVFTERIIWHWVMGTIAVGATSYIGCAGIEEVSNVKMMGCALCAAVAAAIFAIAFGAGVWSLALAAGVHGPPTAAVAWMVGANTAMGGWTGFAAGSTVSMGCNVFGGAYE